MMKFLYGLPAWIHDAVYWLTGWVLVKHTSEDGRVWFSWSNDYPGKVR